MEHPGFPRFSGKNPRPGGRSTSPKGPESGVGEAINQHEPTTSDPSFTCQSPPRPNDSYPQDNVLVFPGRRIFSSNSSESSDDSRGRPWKRTSHSESSSEHHIDKTSDQLHVSNTAPSILNARDDSNGVFNLLKALDGPPHQNLTEIAKAPISLRKATLPGGVYGPKFAHNNSSSSPIKLPLETQGVEESLRKSALKKTSQFERGVSTPFKRSPCQSTTTSRLASLQGAERIDMETPTKPKAVHFATKGSLSRADDSGYISSPTQDTHDARTAKDRKKARATRYKKSTSSPNKKSEKRQLPSTAGVKAIEVFHAWAKEQVEEELRFAQWELDGDSQARRLKSKKKAWQRDHCSELTRREIQMKLRNGCVLFLQKVPPTECKIKPTRCAYEYCSSPYKLTPEGAFRLSLEPGSNIELQNVPDKVLKGYKIPGRGSHGATWYCLTCVEALWNGPETPTKQKPDMKSDAEKVSASKPIGHSDEIQIDTADHEQESAATLAEHVGSVPARVTSEENASASTLAEKSNGMSGKTMAHGDMSATTQAEEPDEFPVKAVDPETVSAPALAERSDEMSVKTSDHDDVSIPTLAEKIDDPVNTLNRGNATAPTRAEKPDEVPVKATDQENVTVATRNDIFDEIPLKKSDIANLSAPSLGGEPDEILVNRTNCENGTDRSTPSKAIDAPRSGQRKRKQEASSETERSGAQERSKKYRKNASGPVACSKELPESPNVSLENVQASSDKGDIEQIEQENHATTKASEQALVKKTVQGPALGQKGGSKRKRENDTTGSVKRSARLKIKENACESPGTEDHIQGSTVAEDKNPRASTPRTRKSATPAGSRTPNSSKPKRDDVEEGSSPSKVFPSLQTNPKGFHGLYSSILPETREHHSEYFTLTPPQLAALEKWKDATKRREILENENNMAFLARNDLLLGYDTADPETCIDDIQKASDGPVRGFMEIGGALVELTSEEVRYKSLSAVMRTLDERVQVELDKEGYVPCPVQKKPKTIRVVLKSNVEAAPSATEPVVSSSSDEDTSGSDDDEDLGEAKALY